MKEIYKKMRKYTLGPMLGAGIVVVFFAILFLFWFGGEDRATYFLPHKNYDKFAAEDLGEKQWYKIDVNEIYDYYGTDSEGYYFIIPVTNRAGDETYMGMYVPNKKYEDAIEICNETFNAIQNDTKMSTKHFKGRGYVCDMTPSEISYFKEYFEEVGAPQDVMSKLVFKTIVYYPISKIFSSTFLLWGILGLLFAVVGIVLIVYQAFGVYKIGIKSYIKKNNISEYDIEMDLANTRRILGGKAEIGNKYLFIYSDPKIIKLEDLMWAYTQIITTKHTTYGINTGTTTAYKFRILDRQKKYCQILIKGELDGREALEIIEEKSPHTILGYTQSISDMANNAFKEMVRIVDERRLGQINE